jgi:gamma-butyrobetaine dioxygenase
MSVEVRLSPDGRSVRLQWPDGAALELGAHWLIDHADGARDPVSGQRLHGALTLPEAARIVSARLADGRLEFQLEPGDRAGCVDLARLRRRADRERTLWAAPDELAGPLSFQVYLTDDEALRQALSRVAGLGLVLLDGAGEEPGTVERAAARFGFIRETNYGRVFDVRIEASPNNLAFSDRGLELHTDNPYRDPPPTLQLLHALIADPEGGETLFVDGFAHAEAFRLEAPEAFELLARTPARFRYADPSGACWTASAPIISLDATGEIETIRLNHRALDLPSEGQVTEAWYDAYLAFCRRVHAPGAALERTLAPGEIVIFDNRRILHGRRGLVGGSPRWLQGCYADRDGLMASLARLDASSSGPTPR